MAEVTLIPQNMIMSTRDNFVEGLRAIFELRKDLSPSKVSKDAGLDDSTIRKLLSGSNSSPRLANAEAIAHVLGYELSTILDIGAGTLPISSIDLASRIRMLPESKANEARAFLDFLLTRDRDADLTTPTPTEEIGSENKSASDDANPDRREVDQKPAAKPRRNRKAV